MQSIETAVIDAGLSARTPVYIYDLGRLRRRCRLLQQLPIANKRLFYATMANDHPAILSCIREHGFGVFVNSPRHLRMVSELGFEPTNVIYAASNMVADEMRLCLDCNVKLVLDSPGQVRAFAELAPTGYEVGLRLSVGSALNRTTLQPDPAYRFGVLPEELPELLGAARGLRITGAHSYFGTGVMNPEVLVCGLRALSQAALTLPDLTYLDVGGGFGVPEVLGNKEFDIQAYAHAAHELMCSLERRLGRPMNLYIEPGRYLVADCGFFFVRVVDRKLRRDRVFVGTDGCVSNFPRTLIYPESALHPCEIVGTGADRPVSLHPVYISGNSTYSQDFLARGISLPLPEPGELLVFHNAGAYCRSMISGFLGKERPEEIVIGSEMPETVDPLAATTVAQLGAQQAQNE